MSALRVSHLSDPRQLATAINRGLDLAESTSAGKANLTGGNTFTGDQTIDGNLTVGGAYVARLGANATFENSIDDYTAISFLDFNGVPRATVFGPTSTDQALYFDCDHLILENLAESSVYIDATASKVDLKAGNTTRLSVLSTGVSIPGLVNAANDAAAATAGVPVNGLYRNGSVLMIRVT